MRPPVRIKVWGLVRLTRRGYLAVQAVGLVLVIVAVVLGLGLPRPEPVGDLPVPAHLRAMATFLDWLPALAILILALGAIETYFVLRKFRQAEAEQAAAEPLPPST